VTDGAGAYPAVPAGKEKDKREKGKGKSRIIRFDERK